MKSSNKTKDKTNSTMDNDFYRVLNQIKQLEHYLRQLQEALYKCKESSKEASSNKGDDQRVSEYQEIGQKIKSAGENLRLIDRNGGPAIARVGIMLKLIGQAENTLVNNIYESFQSQLNDNIHRDLLETMSHVSNMESLRQDYQGLVKKSKRLEEASRKNENKNRELERFKKLMFDQSQLLNDQSLILQEEMKLIWKKFTTNSEFFKIFVDQEINYHQRCIRYILEAKDFIHNFIDGRNNS